MKDTTFIAKGIFFCPVAVHPIRNAGCWTNKPKGGFWTSPKESSLSWEHWCRREDYFVDLLSVETEVKLDQTARILRIYDERTMRAAYTHFRREIDLTDPRNRALFGSADFIDFSREDNFDAVRSLDYQEIAKTFDAIHIAKEVFDDSKLAHDFHAWDCETLLVFDPSIVSDQIYRVDGERVELTPRDIIRAAAFRDGCMRVRREDLFVEFCRQFKD